MPKQIGLPVLCFPAAFLFPPVPCCAFLWLSLFPPNSVSLIGFFGWSKESAQCVHWEVRRVPARVPTRMPNAICLPRISPFVSVAFTLARRRRFNRGVYTAEDFAQIWHPRRRACGQPPAPCVQPSASLLLRAASQFSPNPNSESSPNPMDRPSSAPECRGPLNRRTTQKNPEGVPVRMRKT